MWKKYENDIGNPNGPIRYVDTKDDSHLKSKFTNKFLE